jgi:tetratricopeptide (TPR) repeat protein
MRKALWIGALTIPLLGAAVAVVALRPQRPWTSDSAEAVAEVERGRQAETKLYMNEAAAHYERALALDPGFVVAKLLLAVALEGADRQRIGALLDEVRAADLERLSESEQFLIRYTLAKRDRKSAEAARVLDAYLAGHPKDASALFSRCTNLWQQQGWDDAERCNRELLEVDPNWVLAYNYLGYIAMAQGRFAEAEKDFRAYKYIAPDQANPYDSLGELYTVTGRYEEAQSELGEALRLRPDFCASYNHLLLVANLSRNQALADEVVARASSGALCQAKLVAGMKCGVTQWKDVFAGDLEGAWKELAGGCLESGGDLPIVPHRIAVLTGRVAEARTIEERVSTHLQKALASPDLAAEFLRAGSQHMEGVRTIVEGRAADAVPLLEGADRALAYRGDGQGVFKLVNRLALATALRTAGAAERAAEVAAGVAAVNPRIAEVFGDEGPLSLTPRATAAAVTAARHSRP